MAMVVRLLCLLLLLLLAGLGPQAAAATLFSPAINNCTKTPDSTASDEWWECSSALRMAMYGDPEDLAVAVELDPRFRYQLGDVPIVGRVVDGGGAVVRPTPGASCAVYLIGGQGGGVKSHFHHATLSGTVLQQLFSVGAAQQLSNAITVAGAVEVASGSWVFIKTSGSGAAPGPVVTWHATRVLFSAPSAVSISTTQLFLLDALPADVAGNSSVYLSTKQKGRNVGGAGLVRVEGGVLGHRSTAYNMSGEPIVTTWGRTQQWTLSDLTFSDTLCAIQLDTTVLESYDDTKLPRVNVFLSGVIETGTVSNVVLRGGAILAAIIDSGGTNGIMFTSVHLWPFSYAGQPSSFCSVLKDTRGYPFYLPETGKYWGGPMTDSAIGGSHAFTGLYMHSSEVGFVSAAGMQDTFSDLMGDGLGIMLWFRYHTWGSLVRGVNCAYVAVCARLSDRATSISFSDVLAPGNAPNTHAGIEIGQGSSAYVSKWMALKGNATRIVGKGVVINTDRGGVVHSLGLGLTENFCDRGSSPCPELASCNGERGCSTKVAGAAGSFGSFSDSEGTAAFGCSLYDDGTAFSFAANSVLNGTCDAPSVQISEQLSTIAGWGKEWSGKYPPWAYNMNTGCPCGQ